MDKSAKATQTQSPDMFYTLNSHQLTSTYWKLSAPLWNLGCK